MKLSPLEQLPFHHAIIPMKFEDNFTGVVVQNEMYRLGDRVLSPGRRPAPNGLEHDPCRGAALYITAQLQKTTKHLPPPPHCTPSSMLDGTT